MTKPRNLNDADLGKVAGGTDAVFPEPGKPKPEPSVKPPPGGGGSTHPGDETDNSGGENDFSQG